jgi:hypothetical protein
MHLHRPTVVASRLAPYQPELLAARNQRDRAVVMRLETLGQFAHGGPLAAGQSAYVQQQLILKMGDAMTARHFLAEAQKTSELVAEIRERLDVFFSLGAGGVASETFLEFIS